MIPKSRSMVLRGHGQPMPDEEIQDKVNGMLQALGARVMDALRAGGKQALDLDERYSDAIYDRFKGNKVVSSMSSTPARMLIDNYKDNGLFPRTGMGVGADIGFNAALHGTTAANLLSRYALPAGGVTLAGKGLYDIAAGLSQPEEEVIM